MLFSLKHLKYNPKAIIIKPTLQGGWRSVQKLQEQLRRSHPNIQVVLSSTFESSIGLHAMLHLADPHEYHGLDTLQYFSDPNHDLLHHPIEKREIEFDHPIHSMMKAIFVGIFWRNYDLFMETTSKRSP